MTRPNSPLRLLAKTYANELITREQYIESRAYLLKRLQTKGSIDASDLENVTSITNGEEVSAQPRSYTPSDWLIIGLGLTACAVLAYVLYG